MPKRKELARHFGADIVVDFKERDADSAILEITGDGIDASVEAVGAQATFEMCVKATRPGGTISAAGQKRKVGSAESSKRRRSPCWSSGIQRPGSRGRAELGAYA